jgi:hypothetical protein
MHAFLLTHATTLPAWMQIFHFPVALMAKSKILVLPVYPAAWPQAKRHWFVLRVQDLYRTLARFAVIRRLAFRYRQAEFGADTMGMSIANTAHSSGLYRAFAMASRYGRMATTWYTGRSLRTALRVTASVSRLWLIGPCLGRLIMRYLKAASAPAIKPSEKVRSVYARWAIKFTPGYYEAKERELAHSRA